jgi:hypothetical protein
MYSDSLITQVLCDALTGPDYSVDCVGNPLRLAGVLMYISSPAGKPKPPVSGSEEFSIFKRTTFEDWVEKAYSTLDSTVREHIAEKPTRNFLQWVALRRDCAFDETTGKCAAMPSDSKLEPFKVNCDTLEKYIKYLKNVAETMRVIRLTDLGEDDDIESYHAEFLDNDPEHKWFLDGALCYMQACKVRNARKANKAKFSVS